MSNDKVRDLIQGLDLQTDLWWLAMMVSGMASLVLAAFAFPESALFWAYFTVMVRLAMAVCLSQQPWGGIFARLLALGLVVGVFEIFADHMLVNWFHSGQRMYRTTDGRLMSSPLYMPIAWACVVVEFGYAILRIYGLVSKKWPGQTGLGLSMLAGGVLAAVVAGCQDLLAIKAGWWTHKPAHAMIAIASGKGSAMFVPVGDFFAFMSFLPVFARYVACPAGRLYAAVRYGIIFAGILLVGYALAYVLVEGPFSWST